MAFALARVRSRPDYKPNLAKLTSRAAKVGRIFGRRLYPHLQGSTLFELVGLAADLGWDFLNETIREELEERRPGNLTVEASS
jgi:hypothetical protein